ncbi:hypothetical protein [Candidatus Reidiella endopervernicosa]|uniref:Uncharacterized protein n=1 Tax=Candidatus Reidiella endopervernicosa TaxID=2738883 RepID=A0A6N0HZG9_9GAMM|nr:hypothetical protein [Candidatus Reidiella endopervernicosa]QKQ27566.1 hypothetical protein HUE57_15680 [Candidatus Reidiella endopervernicosa]
MAEQTATAVQTTDGREFGLFWMLDLFGRTSFVARIDQMDHSRWFGPSSDVQSAKFQLLGTICALPPCDGGNQLDVIEPCFVYAPGSDDLSQILIEDPGVNIIAPSKAQGAAVLGDDSMCDSDVDEPENNESLVPIWPIEEEVDGVGYLSGDF